MGLLGDLQILPPPPKAGHPPGHQQQFFSFPNLSVRGLSRPPRTEIISFSGVFDPRRPDPNKIEPTFWDFRHRSWQAGVGSQEGFREDTGRSALQPPRPQGLALVSSLGQRWPTEIEREPQMHTAEEILNFLVVCKNEKGTGEINFNDIFYVT